MDTYGLLLTAIGIVLWLVFRRKSATAEKWGIFLTGLGIGFTTAAWVAYSIVVGQLP
jgi:vacuolar-type H+-ATPase subunit I/STV1